jgi:hypothetical protein
VLPECHEALARAENLLQIRLRQILTPS